MKKFFDEKIAEFAQLIKSSPVLTSLILVIVTFSMTVVSSFAWITANRDLDANDIGMGLAIDDTSAIYKVYMYDLDKQEGSDKIKIDGAYQDLNLYNLHMNQYDTIFKVQNKFTPAFAQIQITKSTSMPDSGIVYLTIERDSKINGLEEGGKLAELISSMLRFTAFIDSTKGDLDQADANALYNYINPSDPPTRFDEIKAYKGQKDHSKTFVTAHGEGDGHGHTKVDSITIAVNYTANDWYEDKNGNKTLNVYLYISYDVQQLECFLNEHSDGLTLEDPAYNFSNDMKKVTVSYEKPTN